MMDAITVKDKKGRVILELNDDLCVFRISKEARRKFPLSDIVRVERYGHNLKARVSLKDKTGKEIAAFYMNMENGPAAMRFFRDCNQGKVTDKAGNLMPPFEIVVLKEEFTGSLEEITGILACLTSFCGALLVVYIYDWLLNGFESTVDWVFLWIYVIITIIPALLWLVIQLLSIREWLRKDMKGLRLISFLLNAGGIVMTCFLWKMPFSVMMKMDAVYPILIWIFYICFHKKMCWSPFDAKKVVVPYVGLWYFDFAAGYYTYVYTLNTDGILTMKFWIFVVFSVLFLAFSYDCDNWLPRAWRIGVLAWITFVGMEGLPVLFDTGISAHLSVEVLQKESIRGGRAAEAFYIQIPVGDGYVGWERISERLYNDIAAGDEIMLCRHESSLSDYYYYHRPEDDCGYIMMIREEEFPWYE